MNRLLLLLITCAAGTLSQAADEPAKKPLVPCIEPTLMRTEASRLLPGSKRTVIVPAREDEFGLARLSKEEFTATGLKWEQFMAQAAATEAAHLKTLKPDIHRDSKNVAQYAVLKSESHLTAGIVLCPEFFTQFREIFGDRLVVLMPDRFSVFVFARGFNEFQTMGPAILERHYRSTWPCSAEAFEVTAEGLKCLGAFEGDPSAKPDAAKQANQKPAAKPAKPAAAKETTGKPAAPVKKVKKPQP